MSPAGHGGHGAAKLEKWLLQVRQVPWQSRARSNGDMNSIPITTPQNRVQLTDDHQKRKHDHFKLKSAGALENALEYLPFGSGPFSSFDAPACGPFGGQQLCSIMLVSSMSFKSRLLLV